MAKSQLAVITDKAEQMLSDLSKFEEEVEALTNSLKGVQEEFEENVGGTRSLELIAVGDGLTELIENGPVMSGWLDDSKYALNGWLGAQGGGSVSSVIGAATGTSPLGNPTASTSTEARQSRDHSDQPLPTWSEISAHIKTELGKEWNASFRMDQRRTPKEFVRHWGWAAMESHKKADGFDSIRYLNPTEYISVARDTSRTNWNPIVAGAIGAGLVTFVASVSLPVVIGVGTAVFLLKRLMLKPYWAAWRKEFQQYLDDESERNRERREAFDDEYEKRQERMDRP